MRRATIQAVRPEERAHPPAGAPGIVLGGKYRLEEAIARGGMARVWRATHVTLNRPVAVKFVDSWGTGEERIERFLREAKVAASVRHRHVVDILDFGTSAEGEPYMVMELLEGETLDQRMSRGAIGDDELVEIAAQLLSGLDAVHRAGIVHRDLKPGNVFLTHDEVDGMFARLLDFGISQGADEVASDERVVVGTPEYMSPEQAFGDPLDARSDIYSIGVVLYEMLSGVLPFESDDPQEVVELVAHGTPMPIAELRPDAPEMCAVVARAMAHDPAVRFESARDLRRAVLQASGRGPDTTGGFAAIPRDSRPSGMQPRALVTASAGAATRSEPPRAEAAAPLLGGRAVIGIVVAALLVAGGAVAWALSQGAESAAGPTIEGAADPAPAPAGEPMPAEAPGAVEDVVTAEEGVAPADAVEDSVGAEEAAAAGGLAAVGAEGDGDEGGGAEAAGAEGEGAEGEGAEGEGAEGEGAEGEGDDGEGTVQAGGADGPAAGSARPARAGRGRVRSPTIVRELDF